MIGANSLTLTANQLTVPQPLYGGAQVQPGQFGAWMPIDSVPTAGGYKIAWKHGAADEYVVWNTDTNGNWLSQAYVLVGQLCAGIARADFRLGP